MARKNKPTQRTSKSEVFSMQKTYSGPYPEPLELAKYEEIQPGFAERLIVMAEKEQLERHRMQEQVVLVNSEMHKREVSLQKRGQLFALLSVLSLTLLCGYGFYLGFPSESSKIAIGVIVAVAGLFITGQWFKKKKEAAEQ